MLTTLRQETALDFPSVKDDPVRPEISMAVRTSGYREVYSLRNTVGDTLAVVCLGFTSDVPQDVDSLILLGVNPYEYGGAIAVPYTVWSYVPGAGRSIIREVRKYLTALCPLVTRIVTLSPLTEMARRFHTGNGAKLLQENSDSRNFEY